MFQTLNSCLCICLFPLSEQMPRTVLSPRPLQTSKYNFLQPADGARCADWQTLFELFISFCTQDENNRVCVGRRIQHPNLLDSTTEHLFYQACLYPPTHCSLCPEARNRICWRGLANMLVFSPILLFHSLVCFDVTLVLRIFCMWLGRLFLQHGTQ